MTNSKNVPRGDLEFVDRETRKRFRSTSILCVSISGNLATISGTGDFDGLPVTFQIDVEQKPRGESDTFFIVLSNGFRRGGAVHGTKVDLRPCR